jgi:hypothetical protein
MPWLEHVSADWSHWNFTAGLDRPMPQAVLARFPEDQTAFDIRFLEDLLARQGEDHETLSQLAYLYTQAKRYREALALDRRLAATRPNDPIAFYNLACSHALLKQITRGFAALKRAIQCGYRDHEQMQLDADLETLRKDPRWHELLGAIKL